MEQREFMIVDGGSTDGTQEWLQSVPHVTLIQHTELVGAIIAFCEGAYRARGKYVLMANDDVTFHPGSIFKAVIHLEKNMTCGAVAFADNRLEKPPFNLCLPKHHTRNAPGWCMLRSGYSVAGWAMSATGGGWIAMVKN